MKNTQKAKDQKEFFEYVKPSRQAWALKQKYKQKDKREN